MSRTQAMEEYTDALSNIDPSWEQKVCNGMSYMYMSCTTTVKPTASDPPPVDNLIIPKWN